MVKIWQYMTLNITSSTHGGLWPRTLPRSSWRSRNTLNQPSVPSPPAFVFTTLSRNQSLGLSLLLSYSWLSLAMDLALDLTQMVQEFRKNLKPTQFFIPNSLCFYNFAQKSIPWVVLALVLLLAVFSA